LVPFPFATLRARFTYSGMERLAPLRAIWSSVATAAKPSIGTKDWNACRMRCWCSGLRKLCARSRVTSFSASMNSTLPLRAAGLRRLQTTMHDSIGEL
jgi:hypothetical protein